MGTGVFISVPAHGDTNPLLATLKELINRGERIIYYGEPEFKDKVVSTGAEFRAYKGYVKDIDFALAEDKMITLYKSLVRYGKDKVDHNLDDIVLDKPDYILHGNLSSWGKVIAKKMNVPVVNLFHAAPMTNKDIKIDFKMMFNFLIPLIGLKIRDYFKSTSNGRIDYLDLMNCYEELNIIYNSNHFSTDIMDLKNKRMVCVGPSLYFKNKKYEEFDIEDEEPVIYISLGTIHSDNLNFYLKCIKAFKNENVKVLLSLGKCEMLTCKIPKNFIVRKSFPQQQILSQVNLFITHGGMNSVNEALYHGVPTIVLPHHLEQGTNARRIIEKGVGVKMKIDAIKPELLREKAIEIINDENISKRCKELQKSIVKDEAKSHIIATDLIIGYVYNN